jgi:hypothetical protein
MTLRLIVLLISLALVACKSKAKPVYIDYSAVSDSVATEDSVVSPLVSPFDIPFREESGIKIIPVKINTLNLDMIFDTGCATTSISIAEANYLYNKGLLDQEDILGSINTQVADGRITQEMLVNLKEVVLGDLHLYDVKATVSANMRAPLLLGNEVLNRIASYTIDNEQQVIHVTPL